MFVDVDASVGSVKELSASAPFEAKIQVSKGRTLERLHTSSRWNTAMLSKDTLARTTAKLALAFHCLSPGRKRAQTQ